MWETFGLQKFGKFNLFSSTIQKKESLITSKKNYHQIAYGMTQLKKDLKKKGVNRVDHMFVCQAIQMNRAEVLIFASAMLIPDPTQSKHYENVYI